MNSATYAPPIFRHLRVMLVTLGMRRAPSVTVRSGRTPCTGCPNRSAAPMPNPYDPPMTDEDWTPNNLDEFEPSSAELFYGDVGSWEWHEDMEARQSHPDMWGYTCSAGVRHEPDGMVLT